LKAASAVDDDLIRFKEYYLTELKTKNLYRVFVMKTLHFGYIAVEPTSNTVQKGIVLCAGAALPFWSESKGTNPKTIMFCPLSHMRCHGWETLGNICGWVPFFAPSKQKAFGC
jgi:hypothetical protein